MSAVILSGNIVCAVGRGCEQAWASVRAGLGRIGASGLVDQGADDIMMGLVPEEALEPLTDEIDMLPLPTRARRMLRLAAPVLRTVAPNAGEGPLRLYLGLPALPASEMPWLRGFALHLGKLAGVAIDATRSRVVPSGRASALQAIELALQALEQEPDARIVVGGVDTHFDPRLLAELAEEERLHGPEVTDGFIPGEGAAFLVLGSGNGPAAGKKSVVINAAASASDPGHRYGTEPARGEGLAQALELLRARSGDVGRVASTFAGFNGESFDAKMWGVACLRHTDYFAPDMVLTHPADCMGDTGAAAGAILTALAATALAKGHRQGPALVWAASDREPRGCALLSAS